MLEEYLTGIFLCYSYKRGRGNAPERLGIDPAVVHVYYDHVPEELTPPSRAPRTKWVFLTSIATTKERALEKYRLGTHYTL